MKTFFKSVNFIHAETIEIYVFTMLFSLGFGSNLENYKTSVQACKTFKTTLESVLLSSKYDAFYE